MKIENPQVVHNPRPILSLNGQECPSTRLGYTWISLAFSTKLYYTKRANKSQLSISLFPWVQRQLLLVYITCHKADKLLYHSAMPGAVSNSADLQYIADTSNLRHKSIVTKNCNSKTKYFLFF